MKKSDEHEIFRRTNRCATQVWILRRTVGYILVPWANKTSRRRQHYYGALPAIAHALLPYVFPAIYMYKGTWTHTQHIFAYTSVYAHNEAVQARIVGLNLFYRLCGIDNNWVCSLNEADPLIKKYSIFTSSLSHNASSRYATLRATESYTDSTVFQIKENSCPTRYIKKIILVRWNKYRKNYWTFK